MVVLRIDYSVWDLQDARKQCQSQTVKWFLLTMLVLAVCASFASRCTRPNQVN